MNNELGTVCKRMIVCCCLLSFFGCDGDNDSKQPASTTQSKEVVVDEIQNILDSVDVIGSVLIFDSNINTFYSNDFDLARVGHLPASTFKIPNSIIALELGTVEPDSTIFVWDGQPRLMSVWERDMTFKEAFVASCYPCYQELALKAGHKEMQGQLAKLTYPAMVFDSSNVHTFWVDGDSRINCFQQIEFLEKIRKESLPIKQGTYAILKDMMIITNNSRYKLYGKTGWSITDEVNNGWFVGYVETEQGDYYFATNITPKQTFDMTLFPKIRRAITEKALSIMNII